jgi:predicted RNA-binding protein with PIN domain
MDLMCNYQGYTGCELILVFDAYKVKQNPGSIEKFNNIYVVYTKEAETADMYIEKTTHQLGRKYKVTVATSDGLEQLIIMGQGALRLSARNFREEVDRVNNHIREKISYMDNGKVIGKIDISQDIQDKISDQ